MLMTCHILNQVSTSTKKETPYELWYKRKPNLTYLRVWGFRVLVIECIFIGYDIFGTK